MQQRTRRYIDVREASEYATGHIQGAELVPLGTLSKECATWDKRQPLTIVCLSGHRATKAHVMLAAMQFEDVDVLPGGMARWRSQGNPVMTSDGAQVSNSRSGWILEGLVILASVALAWFFSPWFLVITTLVGIRLILQR